MTSIVELTSKDNQLFQISKQAILMSGLIKDMLDESADDETPKIPVPNVDSKPLKKVIEYCEYHHINPANEIEKPLVSKIEDVISEWDKQFLEMDQSLLIELIMAANYLNVKELLDLTCAKVASMVRGKTPLEIRELFGIVNDFTPEEEEKIKVENQWCMES